MTLLLGPPSSGKSTLLLALAGKLDPQLKVTLTFLSVNWFFWGVFFFILSHNQTNLPNLSHYYVLYHSCHIIFPCHILTENWTSGLQRNFAY